MNVSAIIVTHRDFDPTFILESLPNEWEKIVWDNSPIRTFAPEYAWKLGAQCVGPRANGTQDLSVYGRYAAIEYASHDLIYVQDDDCIVSDPQAIVDAYAFIATCPDHGPMKYGMVAGHAGWVCWHDDHDKVSFSADGVVCNMPPEFRHDGYTDSALVGFGACFHRDAPEWAFQKWGAATFHRDGVLEGETTFADHGRWSPLFLRECDAVFTTLTPRVLVDVPIQHLPYAHDDNRMWKQPTHVEERAQMLELARAVRDA